MAGKMEEVALPSVLSTTITLVRVNKLRHRCGTFVTSAGFESFCSIIENAFIEDP
jgi:hypothetical protein